MLTRYQKFKVERVTRSSINFAHYNPRKISDDSRKRLTKNIKQEAGLIETVVVNRLTGNLVSGHQRLTILDKLEGYPQKDYELDVAMVEMSEEEERRQNVFMNAKGAQGEFDPEQLKTMMEDSLMYQPEDFGLTEAEIALIGVGAQEAPGGLEEFEELFTKKQKTAEEKEESKQKVKDMKASIKEGAAQKAADKALSYLVLNFESYAAKTAFARRFDLDPADTFFDGQAFSEMVERIYNDDE